MKKFSKLYESEYKVNYILSVMDGSNEMGNIHKLLYYNNKQEILEYISDEVLNDSDCKRKFPEDFDNQGEYIGDAELFDLKPGIEYMIYKYRENDPDFEFDGTVPYNDFLDYINDEDKK